MEPILAFAAALAVSAAGVAAARVIARPRAALAVRTPGRTVDVEGWRQAHVARIETYAEFAAAADRIGAVVEMWPALPQEVRHDQRAAAAAHLRDLEQRRARLVLHGGPVFQAAAGELVDACTRLVDALDVDAPSGPVTTAQRALAAPFLRAGREHLDAEARQHFGA
ncbi:hypothetical protein ABTY59_32105 [Streptomyces sp. NPDC096079]|uniref:hypothetical protein n=1 Tax=Streptomyces sp. NPDC096079 TaxID=3155820 RepID=UPI003322674B